MGKIIFWKTFTIVSIWSAVAVISIFAPDLVMGSDIRIPVGVISSPAFAVIATKYVINWECKITYE